MCRPTTVPLVKRFIFLRFIWPQSCQVLRNNKDLAPQFLGVRGRVYSDFIVNEVHLRYKLTLSGSKVAVLPLSSFHDYGCPLLLSSFSAKSSKVYTLIFPTYKYGRHGSM